MSSQVSILCEEDSEDSEIQPVSGDHHKCCFKQLHDLRAMLCTPQLETQVSKLAVAILYCFVVMFFLGCMLVVVHMRLPDRTIFPQPLPDILLDYLPISSWGFIAAERLIMTLVASCAVVIVFHSQGLVVARRLVIILATIYLYRAFCVVATQLSESNLELHHICQPISERYTFSQFVLHALHIMFGMGMRSNGGQTCGDYIFSGHTVSLTTFNLVVVYYTPRGYFLFLPLMSSLANLFGALFILMAHEHYTVDVVLALIITLLVFSEYHNVAHFYAQSGDAVQLSRCERVRLLLFSPMAYLMERNGEGKLENSYRIPFKEQILRKWRNRALKINETSRQADMQEYLRL